MKALFVALALVSANANAMLVCTSSNDYDPEQSVAWTVGTPFAGLNVGPEQFVSCAASGPELAYLKKAMPDLPMTTGKIVLWRGDNARFIADNLPQ